MIAYRYADESRIPINDPSGRSTAVDRRRFYLPRFLIRSQRRITGLP